MRHKLIALLVFSLLATPVLAGRPILLVTPQGVYQAEVTNGVPGPWTPMQMDVIVQGFTNIPTPPVPVPVPPVDDSVVNQVKALSVAPFLKDKAEGTAVAAIINSISKLNLPVDDFKQAVSATSKMTDTLLKADGRIIAWTTAVLAVTGDAAKIKAGLAAAWGIESATLEMIDSAAAQGPGQALTAEAVDFLAIIEIIRMVIQLLKELGILN